MYSCVSALIFTPKTLQPTYNYYVLKENPHFYKMHKFAAIARTTHLLMLEPPHEVVGVSQVPLRMLSRSISVKPCARRTGTLITAPAAILVYIVFS